MQLTEKEKKLIQAIKKPWNPSISEMGLKGWLIGVFVVFFMAATIYLGIISLPELRGEIAKVSYWLLFHLTLIFTIVEIKKRNKIIRKLSHRNEELEKIG